MSSEPIDEYTPTTEEALIEILRDGDHYERVHFGVSFEDEFRPRSAARAISRWLAAHDREVAAKAWDEGFDTGYDRVLVGRASVPGAPDLRKNPYAEGGRP